MQSLSKSELLTLLSCARSHSNRDWLMILVTYWHGLRASEAVGFTPDSVAGGYITIQRLKGSERTIQRLAEHSEPLLNERAALLDWISRQPQKQSVFKVCRQHFWRLMQK